MNQNHRRRTIIAILGLAAFSTLGYAVNEKPGLVVLPPTHAVVTMTVVEAAPSASPAFGFTTVARPDVDSARWNEIKDQSYASRPRFIAGLKQMEQRVGDQLNELRMNRASIKVSSANPNADLAIRELGYARSYLKYMGEELNKATPQNWNQQKAKVGEAWVRTQEFYAMGKSGSAT